MKLRFY